MSRLHIYLLGPPRFEIDSRFIKLAARKAAAIIAYLAVTGRFHGRDALATFLWPDNSQNRNRLRHALWVARKALGEEWLLLEGDQVGLAQTTDVWVDVVRFRELIASVKAHGHADAMLCQACLSALSESASLYQNDFLAGFTVRDSVEFDEWQFFQAEGLRQELDDVLAHLATDYGRRQEYDQAIAYARRRIRVDLLHEPAHRQLMELYAAAGQQGAALRQYEEVKRILTEQLGISPDEDTQRLAKSIKKGHLSQGPKRLTKRPAVPLPAFLSEEDTSMESSPVFVGRERELTKLEASLKSARSGHGKILFVIGSAGRGKTSLVQEFARRALAAHEELLVVAGHCNAHTGKGDPYLPFRELLSMLTGDVEARWAGGLMTSAHARDLWQAMTFTVPALVDHAPELVNSLVPGRSLQERANTFASSEDPWFRRLVDLVSEERRTGLAQKQLFTQVTACLKTIALWRPLLLLIEDLHWVDSSSNALLFHLGREISDGHILILGTYRPEEVWSGRGEERHPLAGIAGELKRQHGDIWLNLGEMSALEEREFVDAFLDTEPNDLDEVFREALFQHTGGHALFTVELLRAMQERRDLRQDSQGRWVASEGIDWNMLPARVEGVIEQRIGRLDDELQAVLRLASIEGDLFTAEVVARVQNVDERILVQRLGHELDQRHRLVTSQFLERQGTQRLSHYRFRHQLFQHYLYHHMDEMERAYLHEEVGLILEDFYGDRREMIAEHLARHFEQAGLTERAIEYLLLSGQKAVRRSANAEAIDHFSHGLELLKALPASPKRDERELALHVAMGVPLQATEGLAAPEVEHSYSRARELAARLGETPQRFPALWGMWLYYVVRAEHETALELGERLLFVAGQSQDPDLLLLAHRAMGTCRFWRGEFVQAREHLEYVISNYELQRHRSMAYAYGASDIKVHCLAYGSLAVAFLGYPDQARAMSMDSFALAEELDHPYSLAMASLFAAWLHSSLLDLSATIEMADRTVRLSIRHGFPFWLAAGTAIQGWGSVERGDDEIGLTLFRQGLDAWRATGAEVFRPYLLSLLADSFGKVSRLDDGLSVLAEATRTTEVTGERFWDAELQRLTGEFILKEDVAEAEAIFQRAVDVARGQQARLLELRAAVSLCRLWQQQGKIADARRMLNEIYGWFSEGFDAADLRRARALIDALAYDQPNGA